MARCTKIINADSEDPKYIINVKQFAKFVVDLADSVAPTDIEEGMRVGVDRNKYQIHIPLPPKIDPTVTMMQVRINKTGGGGEGRAAVYAVQFTFIAGLYQSLVLNLEGLLA